MNGDAGITACGAQGHAEPQLVVGDSGFAWICPRCKTTVGPPQEFSNKALRLEIIEETENLNAIMRRMAEGRPSAVATQIYESANDIYTCLVAKILEEVFPGKKEFDEADRLQLALLALRAEKKVFEEEFIP